MQKNSYIIYLLFRQRLRFQDLWEVSLELVDSTTLHTATRPLDPQAVRSPSLRASCKLWATIFVLVHFLFIFTTTSSCASSFSLHSCDSGSSLDGGDKSKHSSVHFTSRKMWKEREEGRKGIRGAVERERERRGTVGGQSFWYWWWWQCRNCTVYGPHSQKQHYEWLQDISTQ